MSDPVLEFLGKFIGYGSAATATAYVVFRFLTKKWIEKWIEGKFSKRLEAFKHQQEIEIHRLRIEIDATLSGVLKLQEKEFETLTEAWSKLDEAFSWITMVVSPMQSFPDLDRMDKLQLNELLEETELRPTQKEKIRTAKTGNKARTYQEEIYWHRIHKVKTVVSDLEIYVVRFGIFFPTDLRSNLMRLLNN